MKRFAFLLLGGFLFATPVFAAPLHDLQIASDDITLEPAHPIARQQVHIYATVHNIGTGDTEATLEFYDGDRKIATKAVSARVGGRPDEIWALWTPMSQGNHLLRVRIRMPMLIRMGMACLIRWIWMMTMTGCSM